MSPHCAGYIFCFLVLKPFPELKTLGEGFFQVTYKKNIYLIYHHPFFLPCQQNKNIISCTNLYIRFMAVTQTRLEDVRVR